jgi:hypothetical protein
MAFPTGNQIKRREEVERKIEQFAGQKEKIGKI